MPKKSHILFLIFVFGLVSLGLTNGIADDDVAILEGDFEFPTADGPEYIQGSPEFFQRAPQYIFGDPDFEKMRDLPTNSQDYQLGTKVGWFVIPRRNTPNRYLACTGFLVGPDLFMTNHHCIHDNEGLVPLGGARIYMDYYQGRGGITARVSALLHADNRKDYALLRLNKPIGNTYGWLELDTTTQIDTSQSVKIIQHPKGRSKEIVRRNTQIVDIPKALRRTYLLAYLADTQSGSSGSPVLLRDGTDVIAINHSGLRHAGGPHSNVGSLMSHIVPEIQQYLPVNFNPSTLAGQTFTVDTPITPLTLPPAIGGTAPYTYTLSPIPAGLEFDSTTRRLSGTPTATGTTNATYTATDASQDTASLTFKIQVIAPLTFNPSTLAGQTFTVDTPITPLTLPPAIGGTAPYTYRLSPIPAGLEFDSTTRRLSGTPTATGTTNATYTATDASQDTASLTFKIQVIAPLTFNPSTLAGQTFTVDTPITPLTLPLATGGTPPYTYKLSPIPDGLDFNPATQLLTGTPTTTGTTDVTYTATDTSGQTASLTFTITVTGTLAFNPSVIADQTFTVGKAVILTLPVATGGTPPYAYTLAPLPGGLSFNATEREMSGTPTAAETTTTTYTVTDAASVSASLTFTITVEVNLDVNRDRSIDVLDLVWVAVSYQMRGPAVPADVNADGVVNVQDLVAVANAIDAAAVLPARLAEEVALAAEAAALAGAAGAPGMPFSSPSEAVSGLTAHRNIAAALSDVRALGTGDGHLWKRLPLLEGILQLLAEMQAIPKTTALLPNYPNPFNPETWIPYHLAKDANVTLTIYDVRGSVVRELVLEHQPAGVYESKHRAAYWDGRNQIGEPVASGLYFYTLTAGDFTATRKMLIAK